MGMGYAANYADTVDVSFVMEVAGEELGKFMACLINEGVDLQEYARDCEFQDVSAYSDELNDALEALLSKFDDKNGLELGLGYHSEDEGERYDDVTGVFWYVTGVYETTKAGERWKDEIKRCNYVTFG